MSIVDDLKNSFDRSADSGNSRDQRSGSSLNSRDSPGSGNEPLDSGSNDFGRNPENPRGFQDSGNIGDNNPRRERKPQKQQRKQERRGSANSQRPASQRASNHPNAQAGRPREGGSSPQISSQTRKEIQNAGLEQNSRRKEPVADRRDDFEELKSQNQQIIELLKRINRNLEQLGR